MITIWNVMCKEKNLNVTFECYLCTGGQKNNKMNKKSVAKAKLK